jgi:hypothetical protein
MITCVVILLSLMKDVAMVVWAAPMRRIKEKMETYVQEHMREKFSGHELVLKDHEGRIRSIETDQVSASSHALKVFMTRADFKDTDAKRDRQLEIINIKTDRQTEALVRIETLLQERTSRK